MKVLPLPVPTTPILIFFSHNFPISAKIAGPDPCGKRNLLKIFGDEFGRQRNLVNARKVGRRAKDAFDELDGLRRRGGEFRTRGVFQRGVLIGTVELPAA